MLALHAAGSSSASVFLRGVLSNFSLCLSEIKELSMESGIEPGQDYYTQDYYNYDQG